jgi:hypothetical protein
MIKAGNRYKAFKPQQKLSKNGRPYLQFDINDSQKNPVTGQYENGTWYRCIAMTDMQPSERIKITAIDGVEVSTNFSQKTQKSYTNYTLMVQVEAADGAPRRADYEEKAMSKSTKNVGQASFDESNDSDDLPF